MEWLVVVALLVFLGGLAVVVLDATGSPGKSSRGKKAGSAH